MGTKRQPPAPPLCLKDAAILFGRPSDWLSYHILLRHLVPLSVEDVAILNLDRRGTYVRRSDVKRVVKRYPYHPRVAYQRAS